MHFPRPEERVLPENIPVERPPEISSSDDVDRFLGSLLGLAVGDALGASVEFRPHQYFVDRPVREMEGGGTWGLSKGQWTDDTSMALCLAVSLISKRGYDPYDQMVRYKWWYKHGYLSSTGQCFDIGNATRDSLEEFIRRQNSLIGTFHCRKDEVDDLSWDKIQSNSSFDINCSSDGVAGNGALMRLAPLPLFFWRHPNFAVEYAGRSARLTHGDRKAVDACRYYAALIVAAVRNESKDDLLDNNFYQSHRTWFGSVELHPDILRVAQGSYKNAKGYDGGIRGKGYIVYALEAALWAFWSDNNSFEKGALAAVNLGDDTDTTAAIYGQLAGAHYGHKKIPRRWLEHVYARELLQCISQWLYFEGQKYNPTQKEKKIISAEQSSTTTSSAQHTPLYSTQSLPYHSSTDSSRIYSTNARESMTNRLDGREIRVNDDDRNNLRIHRSDARRNSRHQSDNNTRSSNTLYTNQLPRQEQAREQSSTGYSNANRIPTYRSNQADNFQSDPYSHYYMDRTGQYMPSSNNISGYDTNLRNIGQPYSYHTAAFVRPTTHVYYATDNVTGRKQSQPSSNYYYDAYSYDPNSYATRTSRYSNQ